MAKNEDSQARYVCSKCGRPVEIEDNVAVRQCEHKDEAIIANINATCTAKSGLR